LTDRGTLHDRFSLGGGAWESNPPATACTAVQRF